MVLIPIHVYILSRKYEPKEIVYNSPIKFLLVDFKCEKKNGDLNYGALCYSSVFTLRRYIFALTMDYGFAVFLLDPVDFKGGYMYLFFLYTLILSENVYLAYLVTVRPYKNNILNVIEIGCSLLMTTFMNVGLVFFTLVIFGF